MDKEIKDLLEMLSLYGGKIVSTASLDVEDINQAKASGRMYVDENGLGFVWNPEIMKMPETVEEVEQFEKWYPLDSDIPDIFKNLDWMHKMRNNI